MLHICIHGTIILQNKYFSVEALTISFVQPVQPVSGIKWYFLTTGTEKHGHVLIRR